MYYMRSVEPLAETVTLAQMQPKLNASPEAKLHQGMNKVPTMTRVLS